MGPAASLEVGSIQIAIASHATYEWCGEQYELLGMKAAAAKFVVAKNPMNYNLAYGHLARGALLLDTPGPTPATLRGVRFQNVRRPYFPADADIPELVPTIHSRSRDHVGD
jgi:microcystin degradation protein MlrC